MLSLESHLFDWFWAENKRHSPKNMYACRLAQVYVKVIRLRRSEEWVRTSKIAVEGRLDRDTMNQEFVWLHLVPYRRSSHIFKFLFLYLYSLSNRITFSSSFSSVTVVSESLVYFLDLPFVPPWNLLFPIVLCPNYLFFCIDKIYRMILTPEHTSPLSVLILFESSPLIVLFILFTDTFNARIFRKFEPFN